MFNRALRKKVSNYVLAGSFALLLLSGISYSNEVVKPSPEECDAAYGQGNWEYALKDNGSSLTPTVYTCRRDLLGHSDSVFKRGVQHQEVKP